MTVLRVIAILVALGGVLDPAVSLSRAVPTPVRVHVDRSDPDAADVEARLRAAVKDRLEFVGPGDAEAHVVVGGARPEAQAFSKPVSLITLQEEPGTEIVAVPSVVHVPVNSSASIAVTIRARGLSGQSSVVVLEDGQVELARAEHRWRGDETATIQLPYLALTAGARRLTVRVEPAKGERRLFDNRVDVLAMAEPRQGRIAVIEPRPSWPAGFVRRELENDPAFRVASILRTSTDVATRAGESPRAVTLDQLLPFEVVIAGAPEELRAAEVDALRRFAELRGGTVVLLPDRRPSGAYTELLPGTAAEQLLAEPRLLEPAGIPASEIVSVPAGGGCPAARVAQWRAGDLFLAARRRPVALLRRAGRVALPRRPALARSRILAGCDHDGSARGTAASATRGGAGGRAVRADGPGRGEGSADRAHGRGRRQGRRFVRDRGARHRPTRARRHRAASSDDGDMALSKDPLRRRCRGSTASPCRWRTARAVRRRSWRTTGHSRFQAPAMFSSECRS